MNIDTFLSNWENKSEEIPNTSRRLYNELEVTLSKSGRYNTIRLNALKSKDKKNENATKFMRWLIKEANKGKFDITLCAQPWGYSFEELPKKEKLRDWYLGFGFIVKWEMPDNNGYEMVYPKPKAE